MKTNNFDELNFFAEVKKRPNMFFGKPSILSLRDFIAGMSHAYCLVKVNYNISTVPRLKIRQEACLILSLSR